jgi:6-phosphofructokinase 1
MSKRIGLLTSGGDCAGLNAAIRAVARRTEAYGWTAVGIHQGTAGLLDRPVNAAPIHSDLFDGSLMRQGGTMLGTTNKGDPFAYPGPDGLRSDRSAEVTAGYHELGLDALIGIGGDGSLQILRRLAAQGGWNLVGIPKTIDNDVGCTEVAIGFDTAVDVATNALDHLQPTAASHSRVMVLEVMGRDAGHIALTSGIAGGADVILIPEIPYSMDAVAAHIDSIRAGGRNFALVVVAEAVTTEAGESVRQHDVGGGTRYGGIGHDIGASIAMATGAEVRVTVLGHVQRGGTPTARDRVIASAFGARAVDLVAEERFDRMVAWQTRRVTDVPLAEVVGRAHCVDPDGALAATARSLGISFGAPQS